MVEEARETGVFYRYQVEVVLGVGVAGIHRLFGCLEDIRKMNLIIVVAGMEGALPSVVGGLVKAPVIAVPTSVGYGANFGGTPSGGRRKLRPRGRVEVLAGTGGVGLGFSEGGL